MILHVHEEILRFCFYEGNMDKEAVSKGFQNNLFRDSFS